MKSGFRKSGFQKSIFQTTGNPESKNLDSGKQEIQKSGFQKSGVRKTGNLDSEKLEIWDLGKSEIWIPENRKSGFQKYGFRFSYHILKNSTCFKKQFNNLSKLRSKIISKTFFEFYKDHGMLDKSNEKS